MGGRPVEVADGGGLHDPARVHHGDPVGDVGDHPQVVGDQHQPHGVLPLKLRQQVHDLRLDRHIERRRRLVRDDQVGAEGQRHRDHDALAHPAAELVRIVAHPAPGGRDAHPVHQLGRAHARLLPGHPPVHLEHLPELRPDTQYGIERRQRVLKDHRQLGATNPAPLLVPHPQQIPAVKEDLPARDVPWRRVQNAQDGLRGHRLARTRLPQHGQRLARAHPVTDPVDRVRHPVPRTELHLQIPYVQQHAAATPGLLPQPLIRHPPSPQRNLGSRASRTASPSMMNASTVRLSAPAGHSSMCGALRICLDASEMSMPQETVGGFRPTPR